MNTTFRSLSLSLFTRKELIASRQLINTLGSGPFCAFQRICGIRRPDRHRSCVSHEAALLIVADGVCVCITQGSTKNSGRRMSRITIQGAVRRWHHQQYVSVLVGIVNNTSLYSAHHLSKQSNAHTHVHTKLTYIRNVRRVARVDERIDAVLAPASCTYRVQKW